MQRVSRGVSRFRSNQAGIKPVRPRTGLIPYGAILFSEEESRVNLLKDLVHVAVLALGLVENVREATFDVSAATFKGRGCFIISLLASHEGGRRADWHRELSLEAWGIEPAHRDTGCAVTRARDLTDGYAIIETLTVAFAVHRGQAFKHLLDELGAAQVGSPPMVIFIAKARTIIAVSGGRGRIVRSLKLGRVQEEVGDLAKRLARTLAATTLDRVGDDPGRVNVFAILGIARWRREEPTRDAGVKYGGVWVFGWPRGAWALRPWAAGVYDGGTTRRPIGTARLYNGSVA